MDKIYRRETQCKKERKPIPESETCRKRNVYMNFRVTENERNLIESRIKMSGLDKNDFFIQSCLYQKILVHGNIRMFTQIQRELAEIKSLLETQPIDNLSIYQIESLRTVNEMLERVFKKKFEVKYNEE